jgi:tetratricopeptide (TPR) repeat protein
MRISLRTVVTAALLILSGAMPSTTNAFAFFAGSEFSQADKKAIDELEQKREWDGMRELAGKRLSANDKDAAWLYVDGYALQKLARCSDAIPRFRLVLLIRAESINAQNELARCLLATGQLDAAQTALMSLIVKSPEFWQAYYNLVLVYVRKQDLRSARIYLEQLRSKNSKMASEIEESEIQPLELRLVQEKNAASNRENEEKLRIEQERLAREVDEAKAQAVAQADTVAEKLLHPEPQAGVAQSKSVDEKLRELKQLYAKKLITRGVFSARQKELLTQ